MIKSAHILIFALLISLASLPLEAQSDIPKPNWSRPMALETAGSIDTQAVLKPLFQLAREGKDECSTAAIDPQHLAAGRLAELGVTADR